MDLYEQMDIFELLDTCFRTSMQTALPVMEDKAEDMQEEMSSYLRRVSYRYNSRPSRLRFLKFLGLTCPHQHRHLKRKDSIRFLVLLVFSNFYTGKGAWIHQQHEPER